MRGVRFLLALLVALGTVFSTAAFYLPPLGSGQHAGSPVAPSAAAAYYVAATGSDGNAGTLASPFATIQHAINAIVSAGVGSTTRTIFVRGGTYSYASATSVGACGGGGGPSSAIGFNMSGSAEAANSGITVSYYPPDGLGSAILDGGSSVGVAKLGFAFCAFRSDSVAIIGLQFTNWQYGAILFWGSSSAHTFADAAINNTITNTYGKVSLGNGNSAAIMSIGSFPDLLIARNVVSNAFTDGIAANFDNASGHIPGGSAGLTISGNVIDGVCSGVTDCGAIWVSGLTNAGCVDGTKYITNNWINGGNTAGTRGLYNDGASCNNQWIGNVIISPGGSALCAQNNSGNNVVFRYNLCDMTSGGSGSYILAYQYFAVNAMTGNAWSNNLVVCNTAGACSGGYAGASSPPNPATVQNNGYFQYGAGTVAHACSGGACSSDATPTTADPLLTCWAPQLGSGSPMLSAPPAMPQFAALYGPLGTVPQDKTTPSWSPTCNGLTLYVQPGTQGYQGAALTVYSQANGLIPPGTTGCSWNATFKYLDCSDANLTLDHVHVEGGIYWRGCGNLQITNSIVDWYPSQTWHDIQAACTSPNPGATVVVKNSTLQSGPATGTAPNQVFQTYTSCSTDVGPINTYDGSRSFDVENSVFGGMPQGVYSFGAGSTILNNEIYPALCGTAHVDAIFGNGLATPANVTVQGNYVKSPTSSQATAAIFTQGGSQTGWSVVGNYLEGGSYTLYNEAAPSMTVQNNTFGSHVNGYCQLVNPGSWGTWTGNKTVGGVTITPSGSGC